MESAHKEDRGYVWFGALFGIAGVLAVLSDPEMFGFDLADASATNEKVILTAACAGIGLAIFGAALYGLATLPYVIADNRGHPNADAIRVCAWVGVIIWPCWFVAIIWAYTNNPAATSEQPHLPLERAPTDGGTFLVMGVDKTSGFDTRISVTAETEANARAKGELRGMIVTEVVRV